MSCVFKYGHRNRVNSTRKFAQNLNIGEELAVYKKSVTEIDKRYLPTFRTSVQEAFPKISIALKMYCRLPNISTCCEEVSVN